MIALIWLLPSLIAAQSYPMSSPDAADYADLTKPYNQRFDYQPAVVATPLNAAEVAEAVTNGHAQGMTVVARSGGHSYIANGLGGDDGAMVVDLRNLKDITFNEDNSLVTLGTGLRLGDIYLALNEKGKAIAAGSCAYVGLGGHSSYGGYGFFSRETGLVVDQVVSIDGVLANGTSFTANADTNQELFWALRGAAGSFAITTAITLKTTDAPKEATFYAYTWNMAIEAATELMLKYQGFVQTEGNPKGLGSQIVFSKGAAQGEVKTRLTGVWHGPSADFSGILQPFVSQYPEPLETTETPGTWLDVAKILGGGELNTSKADNRQDTFYAKSLMSPEAEPHSEKAVSALMTYFANEGFASNLDWFVQAELYGGHDSAINAVAKEDTAFYNRDSLFTWQFYSSTADFKPPFPDESLGFLNNMVDTLIQNEQPEWAWGAYFNYIDDQLIMNGDWQNRYFGSNYDRLATLKAQLDPQNTFKFPGAIEAKVEGAPAEGDAGKDDKYEVVPAASSGNIQTVSAMLAGLMLLVLSM